MPSRFSRRDLFRRSAAGAAAVGLAGPLWAEDAKKPAPSERVRLGLIGVGGQGRFHVGNAASQEVIALCDIDENRLGEAGKKYPNAKRYADYRKVLDHNDIDAVIICTPDHMHAVPAVAAMKAGKDVYCEKPLGHSVHETRVMTETAAQLKRVTQMGTQIHAGSNYRRVVEVLRSGAIGKVTEVHTWVPTSYAAGDRSKDTPPLPAGVSAEAYDLWLGPAPARPYHPEHFHFRWRHWWDFGGGATSDMACHHMDLPFWALDLGAPERVSAEGPTPPHPDGAPKWLIARYEFPARGDRPAVKLTWYSGGKKPALIGEGKVPDWNAGNLFVGDKGMLLADYGKYKLLPEKDFADFKAPPKTIPDSIGHHKEWFEAIKTRGQTTCNFAYAGNLTEAVLLANVAYRAGEPIVWDAANLKAAGTDKAAAFLRREYRKGWSL
jgi:predicted dehydrogenase